MPNMPSPNDRRVAYTPLGQMPTQLGQRDVSFGHQIRKDEQEGDSDDGDEQEGEDEAMTEGMQIFETAPRSSSICPTRILHLFVPPKQVTATLGLRQLRALLYLLAALLLFVFIVELTSSASHKQSFESQLEVSNKSSLEPELKDEAPRPRYDSYLSSILNGRNLRSSLIDSTTLLLDDLANTTDQSTHSNDTKDGRSKPWWFVNQQMDSGKYVSLSNYVRAMKSFNYNSSVTLTTQATTEFMYHTLELCKRWDGPISIAVFCPGAELTVAITLIKFMRNCLPALLSACISDKVTWHVSYNRAHGPPASSVGQPHLWLDSKNFPLLVHQDLCPKFIGPEPEDLIKQFEVELRKKNGLFPNNYRRQFQLTYPINVLRNVARLAARTEYVLASDIELYPSRNLVPAFIKYITEHDPVKEFKLSHNRFIFTLPIFEVKSNISAPLTKKELIELVKRGDAIFFHKWVCDACQNFPNRLGWLQTGIANESDELPGQRGDDDELQIFGVTQRDRTRSFWEPIFIGTNNDPLYDDRLTWDGRRDKMGQMYEMCLRDYRLLILSNAFLVHAPGIKHIDKNDTAKRLKYLRENNAIYDATIAKLKQIYSNSSNIDVC